MNKKFRIYTSLVFGLAVFVFGCTSPSQTQDNSPANSVPLPPSNVTIKSGNGHADLTWVLVSNATVYNIYRSTSSGTRGPQVASVSSSSFSDTSLTNGTTYYYQITSANSAGESSPSSEMASTPFNPAGKNIVWSSETMPSSQFWNSTAYGNGVFVAVSNGAIVRSIDGVLWTQYSVPGSWQSVTFGNGVFVAISPGRSVTSADGITWISHSFSGTGYVTLVFGNGMFVAVGPGSGSAITSIDGISWTVRNFAGVSFTSGTPNFVSLAYGNGKFVAVTNFDINGQQSGNRYVLSSLDGINWTVSSSLSMSQEWVSVTFGNGNYIATANTSNWVALSSDGVIWSSIFVTTSAAMNSGQSLWPTYGAGMFVLVESKSNSYFTSADGSTWALRTAGTNFFYPPVFASGVFVAGGSTSTPGIVGVPDAN